MNLKFYFGVLCFLWGCAAPVKNTDTDFKEVSNNSVVGEVGKALPTPIDCDSVLMDSINYESLFCTYRHDNALIGCPDSLPVSEMPHKEQIPEHKQVFGDKRFSIFVRRESGGLIHDKAENLWIPYHNWGNKRLCIWILDKYFYPIYRYAFSPYLKSSVDTSDSPSLYVFRKSEEKTEGALCILPDRIGRNKIYPEKSYIDLVRLIKYLRKRKPPKENLDFQLDIYTESYGISWYAPEFH